METAFSWIGELARFFGSLLPRLLIVKFSHNAVKYVHGSKVVLLEPGLHVYWPIVTEIEMCAVVRQVQSLQSQVLDTKDGVTVLVDGLICYSIDDTVAFLAENENSYDTIDDVATAAIRSVVVEYGFEELRSGSARVNTQLTRQTQKMLKQFGVVVEYARFTNFARCRVLHLSGGPMSHVENHVTNPQ